MVFCLLKENNTKRFSEFQRKSSVSLSLRLRRVRLSGSLLLPLILEIKATEFHRQSSVYKDNFKETHSFFFNKDLERIEKMITLKLRNNSEKEHTAEKCEEHKDVQRHPFKPSLPRSPGVCVTSAQASVTIKLIYGGERFFFSVRMLMMEIQY